MNIKSINLRNGLAGLLLIVVLVLGACGPQSEGEREDGEHSRESRESGEHERERSEGNESNGKHLEGGEQEGSGANALSPTETYDVVRGGARLILNYDSNSKAFSGTVENTTGAELDQVRVEIHLSNGSELGPTTATNMAPGEVLDIELSAADESFKTWAPHAEVGRNEHGAEGEAEGGSEGHSESGGSESGEAHSEGEGHEEDGEEGGDPSSPILALDEGWDGIVNGVRTAISSDSAAGSFSGIVENVTDQKLCSIQIELNLKQGTKTVVELGPAPVGDLEPGEQANVEMLVAEEADASGLSFDAWEIHPELFDCSGEGAEGGEEGESSHDEGGEGGHDEGEGDGG